MTAKDAAATTSASTADILKTYMLDRDGRPVDGILLDWFAGLVLIVYLVAMERAAARRSAAARWEYA